MIYLDSSVALAHLFGEPRQVPASFWDEELVSSRLLEYEIWNRIHVRGIAQAHQTVRELIASVTLLELDRDRLARALEPFPIALRTLDSLHLASMHHLREKEVKVELASFDRRMLNAARALGIPLYGALHPHGSGSS